MNPLIYEGAIREVLVVGVDNTDNRTYELTYSADPQVGCVSVPVCSCRTCVLRNPHWCRLGCSSGVIGCASKTYRLH